MSALQSRPTLEQRLAAAEAEFPGITTPATVWHQTEIIRRLDRLIELAERQLAQAANR